MFKIKVADIKICLDLPDYLIGKSMDDFKNEFVKEDVYVGFTADNTSAFACAENNIQAHYVYTSDDIKTYILSPNDSIRAIQYKNDCSYFTIISNKTLSQKAYLLEAVNSALKRIVTMAAAQNSSVFIHSSTIELGNEAICFSAESGTGKTTHTNLWRMAFPEHSIRVLNGDTGFILNRNNKAEFYSAPWCGTSGENINANAPVKALVFLEQAPENTIRKLSIPEAFMRLSARCFMPAWDKELKMKSLDTAETLAKTIDCYLLKCLPNEDAARVCYNGIFK